MNKVFDCDGAELRVGDSVIHRLAEHVLDWKDGPKFGIRMRPGVEMLSIPFDGPAIVEKLYPGRSPGVRLGPMGGVPVFGASFLRRVARPE